MATQPREVIVTTKNTLSLTLGIISLVIGVLAILVGWIPFLGLLAIPFAVIGLFLAGIGGLIALVKGFKGIGMPLLGGFICAVGFILPILSTGATSAAITKAADEVSQDMKKAREDLAEHREKEERREREEKDLYIAKSLRLYDVEVKYMASVLDGRVPGVVFKIKNEGDRSLDKVEVTVYFKDASGAVIAEEDYLPVLTSRYSRSSKPLKPGYVWQMESGKFYSAKSVPSEWEEGRAEARITDIRFSEEGK